MASPNSDAMSLSGPNCRTDLCASQAPDGGYNIRVGGVDGPHTCASPTERSKEYAPKLTASGELFKFDDYKVHMYTCSAHGDWVSDACWSGWRIVRRLQRSAMVDWCVSFLRFLLCFPSGNSCYRSDRWFISRLMKTG